MNNIIFITGASSDIGISLIHQIKEECLIIAHCNSADERLLETAKAIKNKLVIVKADFSDEESITNMLATIESEYGLPNKIVHIAAPKFENIRFKDLKWSNFEGDINVSLKSIYMILNRFLPQLAKEKRGKVVFILSSVTLNVPPKALAQYTTVKYALLGLVKSLASEYGEKKISINAVSPSMIETKFLSNINEILVEAAAHSNPLKRNAVVSDVIPTILLLLSEESNYINGVNIPITGGSIF
jgi:3-oxoacyl-[acyl-carrier protein] reductase